MDDCFGYDKSGSKITADELNKLYMDGQYKIINRTDMASGAWASTVWLGIDHSYVGTSATQKPVIFETMIFPDDSYCEVFCKRYSTEEEAEVGHVVSIYEYMLQK